MIAAFRKLRRTMTQSPQPHPLQADIERRLGLQHSPVHLREVVDTLLQRIERVEDDLASLRQDLWRNRK